MAWEQRFTDEELAKLPKWAQRKINDLKNTVMSLESLRRARDGEAPEKPSCFMLWNLQGEVLLPEYDNLRVVFGKPRWDNDIEIRLRNGYLEISGGRAFLPRSSNVMQVWSSRPMNGLAVIESEG